MSELAVGPELDAAVAEARGQKPCHLWEPLGYGLGAPGGPYYSHIEPLCGNCYPAAGGPCHYSTSISAAWELVEKLDERWWPEVGRVDDGSWYCEIVDRNAIPLDVSGAIREVCDTAPEAICRAFLAAKGVSA